VNRLRAITSAIVIAAPAIASSARAQSGIDRAAMAEVLFDDGRRLVAAGRYPEACVKFAESERLDHGVGTLLNLADCYEHAGRLASAWAEFRAAAAAAAEAGQPDREAIATDRMRALTPALQRLALRVPPADAALPQFELRRDDIRIDPPLWGVPVPIDSGPHRVEARASNRKVWAVVIDVPARRGAVVTQNVPRLEEKDVALPSNAPAGGAGVDGRKIGAIALFGAAGVGAVVGTIFGARAVALNGSSNEHCVGDRCDAIGVSTRNDARTSGDISTGAFIAAVALAGAGGALLFFSRAPKNESSASIGLAPSASGASLVAGGRF
jgi:serine/threonine-protein kinase